MALTEDEIHGLVRKRGSVKMRLTLFESYVEGRKRSSQQEGYNFDPSHVIELEQRISTIRPLLADFEEIQSKLEVGVPEEELEAHFAYRNEFETKFHNVTSTAQSFLKSFKLEVDPEYSDAHSVASHVSENSTASNSGNNQVQTIHRAGVKLPTIEIPHFNGNYDSWLEFRDTFDSLIHQHSAVSDIHKFHYLKSSLTGEAKQVIKSLDFSHSNYEKAWNAVCNRYNNTRLLINNHIKALFEMDKIASESSQKLRSFSDSIDKHLCALQSLEQPTEHWDTLIIHMATLKLDNETHRKWEEHQVGSDPPTLEQFQEFLSNRADFLESIELKQQKTSGKPVKSNSSRSLMANTSNSNTCPICKADHAVFNCAEFQKLPVNERFEKAKSLRLRLNCLKSGHYLGKCKNRSFCKFCNGKHNSLLHLKPRESDSDQSSSKTDSDQSSSKTDSTSTNTGSVTKVSLTSYVCNQTVLLGTVHIIAFDKFGNPHNIRAILDVGSQSSYITQDLCKRLGLDTTPVEIKILGISQASTSSKSKCTIIIQSQHNAFSLSVSCLILSKISDPIPEVTFQSNLIEIPKHLKLADPMFNQSKNVDMLLGADCFWDLLCAGQVKLGQNRPVLQKIRFGWVVSGPLSFPSSKTDQTTRTTRCHFSREIEAPLNKFWEIEEHFSLVKPLLKSEVACENIFQSTTTRSSDGRFVVSIPFKDNPSVLGDSKEHAIKLFKSLENRFKFNPLLKERYLEFMAEYESMGHMSKVEYSDASPAYYLPHYGVTREESETTKLRVVFNASSPTSNGLSLNQIQHVGPTVQNDLLLILLRFRKYEYVVTADVAKMYRQVLIKDEHRPWQRIVWRSNPSSPISIYNLNTVTYGTASAPFLATRCLVELANDYQSEYPHAAEAIKRDFYVDDFISGSDNIESLQRVCNEVSSILDKGKFPLRKWFSKNLSVLKDVQKENWSSHCVNFSEDDVQKTLGIIWLSKPDILSYKVSISESTNVSKRSILSETSKVFDPLGLVSPCIIIAKMMLQELWQLKLTWDDSLPLSLHTRWMQFKMSLPNLNEISIPRHVLSPRSVRVELHGFADACQKAYGACIYIRSFSEDGEVVVRLLCAKGKVCPLKPLTIHRLELCAALTLVRLCKKAIDSLHIKFDECFFYSDSTIVLGWINTEPNKLTTFVCNRVAEIQSFDSCKWFHVATADNPADLVSRGVSPCSLKASDLWWLGPPWLSKKDPIPKDGLPVRVEPLPELKQKKKALIGTKPSQVSVKLPFDRFSNPAKLDRVVAYVLRYKYNLQHPKNRAIGPLQVDELRKARLYLIKIVQMEAFSDEFHSLKLQCLEDRKSKLNNLAPFIHSDETIRVGGRLQNSQYSFDKMHPIVLPSKHRYTKLLFEQEHRVLLHCGPQHLLSSLRETYWPIGGRNIARKTVLDCGRCARLNPKPFQPMMGNLPSHRITPAYPFHTTGVDYAGPLQILSKKGRGGKVSKCYICLFVCLATKCVHIEAVSELSTEAFLMTLRRFVGRRGKPAEIFSDNGSNFIGASNELRELAEMLQNNADFLIESMANDGVTWHFIPSRSPHFGGIWEAGVRSVKHHFKCVVGNANLTFEELTTLLVQIEAILNSRPISPLSSDANDFEPLTPGHFLVGRPLTALPELDLNDKKETQLLRHQRIQKLQQHFWQRWQKEYLCELQRRQKWTQPSQKDVTLGMMVVLKDDNLPPLRWRLGRICELHPGADGIIRVVTVKTAIGTIKRAVAKLCPLPCNE